MTVSYFRIRPLVAALVTLCASCARATNQVPELLPAPASPVNVGLDEDFLAIPDAAPSTCERFVLAEGQAVSRTGTRFEFTVSSVDRVERELHIEVDSANTLVAVVAVAVRTDSVRGTRLVTTGAVFGAAGASGTQMITESSGQRSGERPGSLRTFDRKLLPDEIRRARALGEWLHARRCDTKDMG